MTAPSPGDGGPRTYVPDFLTELFRNPLDAGYAEAAQRRAATGPPSTGRRVIAGLAAVVTLVAVGFLLVVAYRHALADEPARSRARAGLVGQVNDRQAETDALQRRADDLRDEVARLRAAALDSGEASRLRELEAATGLARVRGDGVVVRLADAPSAVDAVTGAGGTSQGRVLDRDLQEIANALWNGGAEAIAINGQRLTSTTTIRRAGGAILVDFRPVTSPYEVVAIGPDDLRERFADSAVARLLEVLVDTYGLSYQLRTGRDLTLPGAVEPQLRYAVPVGPVIQDSAEPTTDQPSATSTGAGR